LGEKEASTRAPQNPNLSARKLAPSSAETQITPHTIHQPSCAPNALPDSLAKSANASSHSHPPPSPPRAANPSRRPAAVCLTARPGQFERWSGVLGCDDSRVTVMRGVCARGTKMTTRNPSARRPASACVKTVRRARYPRARTSSPPASLCGLTAVQSSRRRDQARRWIGRRDGL
jgi:hypothetical protein